MSGYLIGTYNEMPHFIFNGTMQECICAYAIYNYNYSEVFKKACLAMETLDQCLELYTGFYNDTIDLVITMDAGQIQYAKQFEKINAKETIDVHSNK